MSRLIKQHSRFLAGFGKLASWAVLSRIMRLGASVWVTHLLAPGDFAVIAVVVAIQGFAEQVTAFNFNAELVRAKELTQRSLAVAWSYGSLRNLGLYLVLFSFAPLFAEGAGRPEAAMPLRVMSAGLLINALWSPRLVELRREGRFGLLGALEAIPCVVYAVLVVVLAHIERSYWALVWAGIGSCLSGLAVSYAFLPWRPRIDTNWAVARPLMSFGIVLLLASGFFALRQHGMVFLLGNMGHADDLGYYNRAMVFSWALAFTGITIYWKVSYPLFSKDTIGGRDCFRIAGQHQLVFLGVAVPAALLVALSGDWLVPWALGAKWAPLVPLWKWLMVASALALANAPIEAAFQASHHERKGLAINAVVTVVHLVLAAALIPLYGIAAPGIAAVSSVSVSLVTFRIVSVKLRAVANRKANLRQMPASECPP